MMVAKIFWLKNWRGGRFSKVSRRFESVSAFRCFPGLLRSPRIAPSSQLKPIAPYLEIWLARQELNLQPRLARPLLSHLSYALILEIHPLAFSWQGARHSGEPENLESDSLPLCPNLVFSTTHFSVGSLPTLGILVKQKINFSLRSEICQYSHDF